MDWINLEFLDEKFYRDNQRYGLDFDLSDIILYEEEEYAIIREYYRFIGDKRKEADKMVRELLDKKKVLGINPGEFFASKVNHPNLYKMSMGPGPKWDMYAQVKSSLESFSMKHPNVYDLDIKTKYQSSYLGRRGTDKRFNFFRICYEHKDKMLINYWNYAWDWQNKEKVAFEEWEGIKFPFFTREQEVDTERKRAHGDYYTYNSQLLYDAVKLLKESKFNIILETYDSGPIITEKSVLSFVAKRIPVFTSEEVNRKSLEKLGFCTFDEIYEGFDVEKTLLFNQNFQYEIRPDFDWEDNKEYYLQWKEIIKKVNSDWGVEYYKSKQDEIQHNFELCKKIDNNTLYSSMGELFDEE